YLGQGAQAGKVSDLAYHNSLMVQIWSMLATGETSLAVRALRALPPTPSTGTWVCYTRCHDDIGWAIDDGDAAAVGLGGWAHRSFLADWYSGAFPGSPARGLVFQANEQTGDRRISGTAASLCGLESARTTADVDTALARIQLAHAIVAGWGGIPVLWSGDELGLTNDPGWAAEPGHEDDNRWAHRPRLDPARAALRDDLTTVEARVFHGLAHLARVRAGLPHLHASASAEVLEGADPGLLVVARRHAAGVMVGVYNVTRSPRPPPVGRLRRLGITDPYDALSGHRPQWTGDGQIWVGPYGASWFVEAGSPHAS
ncbi:MAG TPA: hypothetical protein VHM65_09875, partial [Candidatus Lustribacter sp.]|nr:hypothetical protein [Candidatus Lustribacter sp.]